MSFLRKQYKQSFSNVKGTNVLAAKKMTKVSSHYGVLMGSAKRGIC